MFPEAGANSGNKRTKLTLEGVLVVNGGAFWVSSGSCGKAHGDAVWSTIRVVLVDVSCDWFGKLSHSIKPRLTESVYCACYISHV